jgi:hypothetical protein
MAFTIFNQGSFLSAGTAVTIPVQSSADYFRTFNQTQAGNTSGNGVIFEWFGNPSFPTYGAWQIKSGAAGALSGSLLTTGGFNYVTTFPQPQAPFVGTAITNASPAVASGFTSLPYNNGDQLILYNTTGMAQIGGATFTVSSVSSSGFTLLGLPAASFATPATAVTAVKVSPYQPVLPEFLYVSNISQASQAVVTVTQDPTNVIYVGQKLVFQIPSSFGMVQLNTNNLPGTQDLPAIVTAVNYAAYQFTINVNTSSFTAFSWPASTASPTAPLFATVAPAGSSTQYNPSLQTYTGYNFNLQPFRSSLLLPYMYLFSGANGPAGQSGDTIVWQVGKMEAPSYGSV